MHLAPNITTSVLDGLIDGRGTTRAEDAQGSPTQSTISPRSYSKCIRSSRESARARERESERERMTESERPPEAGPIARSDAPMGGAFAHHDGESALERASVRQRASESAR